MAWNQTKGQWNELVGEVRRQWGKLTHDDIAECKGNRDILLGKLQKLYGMTRDEAALQVNAIEQRLQDAEQGAERMYGTR